MFTWVPLQDIFQRNTDKKKRNDSAHPGLLKVNRMNAVRKGAQHEVEKNLGTTCKEIPTDTGTTFTSLKYFSVPLL